ncbi:hypothetical protein NIES4102_25900 [Chondrocystis sp. NIES-4102]|nr:hypothetical protein NIES4102_25900 [Chondrocystis sp. NIES-4102]
MAGAKGYLLKGTSTLDLIGTIFKIHHGLFQLGAGLLEKVASHPVDLSLMYNKNSQDLPNVESLTKQQINKTIEDKLEEEYLFFNEVLEPRIQTLKQQQNKINDKYKDLEMKFYILILTQLMLIVYLLTK